MTITASNVELLNNGKEVVHRVVQPIVCVVKQIWINKKNEEDPEGRNLAGGAISWPSKVQKAEYAAQTRRQMIYMKRLLKKTNLNKYARAFYTWFITSNYLSFCTWTLENIVE